MGSAVAEVDFTPRERLVSQSCRPGLLKATLIPDDAHSLAESRWVTMGKDRQGDYVLVVHTYEEIEGNAGRIQIISARPPARTEIRLYEAEQ